MLNSRSIQGIIAIVLGLFLAIWLGMALVTDQLETLFKFGGVALLLTAAYLGQRVWLLFIFFTSLNVVLYRWAGTVEVGQAIFIVFAIALFLMRKLRYQIQFTELEFWVLLIIACILQAYIRNPVGLNIFGAGNVGGRPYVVIALWVVSAAILSTLIVPPRELKWALRISIIGSFLGIPLQMARYGNLASTTEGNMELAGTRIPTLAAIANVLARWISSLMSPLRACLNPWWGLILLASVAFAAASGYRNAVANVGFIYLVAICYHGGFKSFFASIVMGAFGLTVLALINLNFPLPGNLQRALSPLPGTWEKQYVEVAQDSTDWRVEMWKEALFSDRWIHNNIIGDGIGMTAEQLAQNMTISAQKIGKTSYGLLAQQENMLVNGSYHSGPVHSVRMVGYVGLVILLLAMIRLAVHAHRQIMRSKGTEWHAVALFFGIPLICQPFFFTFVFGEYHTGVAQTLMGMAMVRLMERNLPLPAYVPRSRRDAHVPLAVRNRDGEIQTARSE